MSTHSTPSPPERAWVRPKTATYKVTGYFDGVVYAMYKDGMLDTLLCQLTKPLISKDNPPGWDMFPLQENDLINCTDMFKAVELKPKTLADKVALFCLKYKQYKKQPYQAQKIEKANLKLVTVNEQLLNTYFTNNNYPLNSTKNMADYVRHYNTVRDLTANGASQSSRAFPQVYDMAYEKIISDDVSKLQRYWAHLRSLGWKKEDGVWKQHLKSL